MVLQYIYQDDFNFKERPDLCINVEGHFESITAEIETKQGKHNLIISEIYRVPNTNERQSIMYYENMISTLCHTKADILIGTDQNFDLMKTDTSTNVSDLLNVFLQVLHLLTICMSNMISMKILTLEYC